MKQCAGDRFAAESAGLEPGTLNPIVVEAMREKGIDISKNTTTSVFDFVKQGKRYDYVITVCDEAQSERCPTFAGGAVKLHWGFDDPSQFIGTPEEKRTKTRLVRDRIEKKIQEWVATFNGV